jgi:phosphohistidine phosphatase SixA
MTLFLVRHAHAGARSKWLADDRIRPLTLQGRHQAADMVTDLAELDVVQILSSPYRRCIETVAPLAAAIGVATEIHEALAEGPGAPAVNLVRQLARDHSTHNIVLCSHGDIIPSVLEVLGLADGLSLGLDPRCQKGSTWILEPSVDSTGASNGTFASASYVPPPR